jgi:hypothetical protein
MGGFSSGFSDYIDLPNPADDPEQPPDSIRIVSSKLFVCDPGYEIGTAKRCGVTLNNAGNEKITTSLKYPVQ